MDKNNGYEVKNYEFGNLLLKYRERLKLTQQQEAGLIEVTSTAISKWEVEEYSPGSSNLKKLTEFYLKQGAFIKGNERVQVEELWLKAGKQRNLDPEWLDNLLNVPPATTPTLTEPTPEPQLAATQPAETESHVPSTNSTMTDGNTATNEQQNIFTVKAAKPVRFLTSFRLAIVGAVALVVVMGILIFMLVNNNPPANVANSSTPTNVANTGTPINVNPSKTPLNGEVLGSIEGIAVNAMAFSRNGRFLVSGNGDLTIKVLSVEPEAAPTGNLVDELRDHKGFVYALKYSWDGKLLASAATDKTIKIWEVNVSGIPTHNVLQTINANTDQLWSLAFSPDNKILASAGENNAIQLWDVATGNLIRTLTGHTGKV